MFRLANTESSPAVIGGATGVALGLLAMHSGSSSCSGNCDGILMKSAERQAEGLAVALLGGIGTVVGTLIGAIPDDQWRPMSDQRVGATITPTRQSA